MAKKRILFLTCHLPFPPFSGGRRREFESIRRLSDRYDMHVCATSKVYEEDVEQLGGLAPHCAQLDLFPAAPLDEAEPSGPAPQIARHHCPPLTARVRELVQTRAVDLVHVEGFYMAQHLPENSTVPVLLVEQNVEFALWRQRTQLALGASERERHLKEYLRTLEAEVSSWRRADLCAALTETDASAMREAAPGLAVRVVPDGADHLATIEDTPTTQAGPPLTGPSLLFAANFAYEPNLDAARLLCHEILPLVRARTPGVRLWLVGNAPPAEILAMDRRSDVVVTGRVPSIEPYLDAADVVVCPLRIGGGVKVKVLEALRRGKAVVTTSVGAQGLEHLSGNGLIVEDDPRRIALQVARLLRRPALRRATEQRARRAGSDLPTWDQAAAALAACYEDLLGHQDRMAPGTLAAST